MRFDPSKLAGAWVIEPEPIVDERGAFGRIWCAREFEEHGLDTRIAQVNMGFSHRRGTLRGLHLQLGEHAEAKLVRCTRGEIYDVIVDMRPDSPTFGNWHGVRLSAANRRMIYSPPGFAQGYLTLSDDAEIYYHTTAFYEPAAATGIRWDDPALGILWPAAVEILSDQDRAWPDIAGRDWSARSREEQAC